MKPSHLIALLLMNVFWAGSYTAFKALSAHLTVSEIVTARFGLAALLAAFLWPLLRGAAPRGRDLVKTALMGLLVFAVGPRIQVFAVNLGKAGDSAVVVAIEPLITAVAAALFLREHVPARRWLGFLIGMFGVVILNGAWRLDLNWTTLAANLVFISSFICESAYSVIGKPLLARASPLKIVAIALILGTVLNLVWGSVESAVTGRESTFTKVLRLPATAWLTLLFLAVICTVIGYTLWYVVIRESDVSLAALTILVQPVFGVAIASRFLAESVHWGQLWGLAAIVAGLVCGLSLSVGNAHNEGDPHESRPEHKATAPVPDPP